FCLLVSSDTTFFSPSFSSLFPPAPFSTLFPYTTLFRSVSAPERRSPRRRSWRPPCRPSEKPSRYVPYVPEKRVHRPPHALFPTRSEEHTSELQSRFDLVCRLLLEKKKEKRVI